MISKCEWHDYAGYLQSIGLWITAKEALKRIGELYAVEDAIRGLPATERLAARQSQSKPLLSFLHEWLVEKKRRCRKSPVWVKRSRMR